MVAIRGHSCVRLEEFEASREGLGCMPSVDAHGFMRGCDATTPYPISFCPFCGEGLPPYFGESRYEEVADSYWARLSSPIVDLPCTHDPRRLYAQPIGMYHCPDCGEMVVAGVMHPDYSVLEEEFA